MFNIVKNWKKYRVHLGKFNAAVKTLAGDDYKGMSADYCMTLWFVAEPTEDVKVNISELWDSLTEESEIAKFKLDSDQEAAMLAARESLLTADFADLISAERKIWMGMLLTAEDKDALLQKYPQV